MIISALESDFESDGCRAARQRTVVYLRARVGQPRVACRGVFIGPASSTFAMLLRDGAYGQGYEAYRYSSCHFRFDR